MVSTEEGAARISRDRQNTLADGAERDWIHRSDDSGAWWTIRGESGAGEQDAMLDRRLARNFGLPVSAQPCGKRILVRLTEMRAVPARGVRHGACSKKRSSFARPI